jgi:hypothetical protein
MTLVANAVADTTTTTGTGAVTLGNSATAITINGAPAVTFATGFTLGGTIAYPISGVGYQITDGTNTETGVGTLTSATNLTRDLIIASSNGGRHVNFIAGSKAVTSTPNWSSAFASATAVPSTTLPENDIQSGTFSGVLTQTGANLPIVIRYKVSGSGEAVLSLPAVTQSTTGAAVTITGVPAFLSPTAKAIVGLVTANASVVLGQYSIAPAASVQGTGTFTLLPYTSLTTGFNAFTQSQTNGTAACDLAYNLF